MFYTVKSTLLIIAFCYLIVITHKIINVLKNYNYGVNSEKILDILDDLTTDEFRDIVTNICALKDIAILNLMENNIYECVKNHEKYLLFINDKEYLLEEDYIKMIYGYTFIKDVKGAIVITKDTLKDNAFEDLLNNLQDIKILFYSPNDYYEEKLKMNISSNE